MFGGVRICIARIPMTTMPQRPVISPQEAGPNIRKHPMELGPDGPDPVHNGHKRHTVNRQMFL